MYYGILVMALNDKEGVVYDIWFTYGGMHEGKVYKIRKAKIRWLRELSECGEMCGDEAYKYVEVMRVFNRKGEEAGSKGRDTCSKKVLML